MSKDFELREDGKYDVFEDGERVGVSEKDEDGNFVIKLDIPEFTYADCYEKARRDARRVVKETAVKVTKKPNINPTAIAFVDTAKKRKGSKFALAGCILTIIGVVYDVASSVIFKSNDDDTSKAMSDMYDACWDASHKNNK